MFLHILISFLRIFLSLIPAIFMGFLLGLLAHKKRTVLIAVNFILNLPKFVFIPISMSIFGIGESAKFFALFLTAVFPIAKSISVSLDTISSELNMILKQSKIKSKASKLALLPILIPFIVGSVNSCITTQISILSITECFGSKYGIGFYIIDCWLKLKYPEMIISIILVCILGSGINFLLKKVEIKLLH